jgi:nucleotide-binding universal stress UspA family protein
MTSPLRTIVAGLATMEGDDPVLATSIHLAERTGAVLHMVHAYQPDEETLDGFEGMGGALRRCPQARLIESQLQAHVDVVRTRIPVECIAIPGKAGEVLSGYAAAVKADVLVLAPTRRAAAAGAVMGTTASRVLRTSAVPVLVLREPLPEHAARRVLLPTDLSEHSARALPLAAGLAAALAHPEAPTLLPLFVSPCEMETGPYACVAPQVEQAEAELTAFLASIPTVTLGGTVRIGSPAHVILNVAREWDADLVVLGTHGRRGMPRFFLGSVAETVLHKAPCSVLVIPPATSAPGHTERDEWTAEPAAGGELLAEVR